MKQSNNAKNDNFYLHVIFYDMIINEIQEIMFLENIINQQINSIVFKDISFFNDGIMYNIGNDSKLISKIIEIIVIKKIIEILMLYKFEYQENNIQNSYPDFMIKSNVLHNKYYAIDIKTSCLIKNNIINGFTLGTYNGYFVNRTTTKSIVLPYDSFIKHYCVCIIYKKDDNNIMVGDRFFIEKWKLASKKAGSGNTCNIGSIKNIKDIQNKKYIFKNENDFNNYWINYKKINN